VEEKKKLLGKRDKLVAKKQKKRKNGKNQKGGDWFSFWGRDNLVHERQKMRNKKGMDAGETKQRKGCIDLG